MPPPWNGRGAGKRGEKVGNTGRALAWCVAYRSMSRQAAASTGTMRGEAELPRRVTPIGATDLGLRSGFDPPEEEEEEEGLFVFIG